MATSATSTGQKIQKVERGLPLNSPITFQHSQTKGNTITLRALLNARFGVADFKKLSALFQVMFLYFKNWRQ